MAHDQLCALLSLEFRCFWFEFNRIRVGDLRAKANIKLGLFPFTAKRSSTVRQLSNDSKIARLFFEDIRYSDDENLMVLVEAMAYMVSEVQSNGLKDTTSMEKVVLKECWLLWGPLWRRRGQRVVLKSTTERNVVAYAPGQQASEDPFLKGAIARFTGRHLGRAAPDAQKPAYFCCKNCAPHQFRTRD
ncbi:hypothetical protein R6Q59_004157 [Mikania micrantha]